MEVTSSMHAAAVAAARAASPSPKPSRSARKAVQANTGAGRASSPAPRSSKPLRAAATVYYDALPSASQPEDVNSQPPHQLGATHPTAKDNRQQLVTITFRQADVLPPVYISSSMSNWRVQEMAFSVDQSSDRGSFTFYKDFEDVQPGKHLYRFRAGRGRDAWVVDEGCEVVKDTEGKEHNVIIVESRPGSVQLSHGCTALSATSTSLQNDTASLAETSRGDVEFIARGQAAAALATTLHRNHVEALPSPHYNMAQFSEIAVSPPADETVHTKGILESVMESAVITVQQSPLDSQAGLMSRAKSTTVNSSPDTNTPSRPLAPQSTAIGSPEVHGMSQLGNTELELHLVNERLGLEECKGDLPSTTQADAISAAHEPAEEVSKLGTIDEVMAESDEKNNVETSKNSEKAAHRSWELLKWISVGTVLVTSSVAGAILAVVFVRTLEGPDVAPLLDH